MDKRLQNNTRVNKWDNAKCALIFLVALGHVTEPFCSDLQVCRSVFFFIYSFHMPAFIFLSGLLGKRLVEHPQRSKLVPLFLISCILHFLRFFSVYITNPDSRFHFFDQSNIAWYLFALVAFYLMAFCVKDFSVKYVLFVVVTIAIIAGYDNSLGSMLSLSRIFAYFPFFYIGYILDEKKLRDFLSKKVLRIASFIILIAFALICITQIEHIYVLRPLLTGQNHYYLLKDPLDSDLGGLYRLVYYPLVLMILFSFIGIIPNVRIPVTTTVGQRTLSVYFWHLVIYQLIRDFTPLSQNLLEIGGASIFLMILLAMALTLVCCLPPFTTFVNALMRPKVR